MQGFNKVILMGNLSRDPVLRYTANSTAVASINIAVNRGKNKNREDMGCDFISVVVWGAQAENCNRYLQKGSPVLLEGRLQVRKYINSNNEDRWTTEVVANSVRFLGSKKDRSGVTEDEFNITETDAPF